MSKTNSTSEREISGNIIWDTSELTEISESSYFLWSTIQILTQNTAGIVNFNLNLFFTYSFENGATIIESTREYGYFLEESNNQAHPFYFYSPKIEQMNNSGFSFSGKINTEGISFATFASSVDIYQPDAGYLIIVA